MKKILKISLFIIVFCLLLILFSNSKVQAVVETVTTLQELQEVMGATAYSTIDGTTLKITDNFKWTISNDIEIKIPELTIDFNGKEIRIENNVHNKSGLNNNITLTEGKVIFNDSQGKTGGIYCIGDFINVKNNSELIIENGHYVGLSEIEYLSAYLFMSSGGTITVNNGMFDSNAILFDFSGGRMTINDGIFKGMGNLIYVYGISSAENIPSILTINGGTFSSEKSPVLKLDVWGYRFEVKINGGSLMSKNADCIVINDAYTNFGGMERQFFSIKWL